MPTDTHSHTRPWYRSSAAIAIVMPAVILVFFVIREHQEHLASRWVYALLLLSPVMHLLGHERRRIHGKSGGSHE